MNDIAQSADADVPALLRSAPSSVEFKKLRKRLLRQAREAISDFGMLPEGASAENRPNGSSVCRVEKTVTRFSPS